MAKKTIQAEVVDPTDPENAALDFTKRYWKLALFNPDGSPHVPGGGTPGPAGASAYDIWLAQGNVGTVDDYLASLVGPEGLAGPEGPGGPAGPAMAEIAQVSVLDVGLAGQVRAGRQLTVADFTTLCGLPTTPVGLFNLADLTNLGSGGALVNKGAVPFAAGILGGAGQAAQFKGDANQALYVADTGANDPFRIKTGSWGAWQRTAKRGLIQPIITKASAPGQGFPFMLDIANSEVVARAYITVAGVQYGISGTTDICDDKFHFIVVTYDGMALRIYVDGALDGILYTGAGALDSSTASPFNIGARGADGATAAGASHYGRIDEAFVTADVLTEDQIRLLYCSKIAHGFGATPKNVVFNVHRLRRGSPLVAADFPAQPKRLHNFTAAALTDAGSDNQALTNNGAASSVAGADGVKDGAYAFRSALSQYLSSLDTGLPTVGDRSVGCWFQDVSGGTGGVSPLVAYGTNSGEGAFELRVGSTGALVVDTWSTNRVSTGSGAARDGRWHFAVVTYQVTPLDGLRFKLYMDGKMVDSAIAAAITTVLVGAGGFRIGRDVSGAWSSADVDAAFLCDYALTPDQIRSLYAKGSQDLGLSPKSAGENIEAWDNTNVYAVFDDLEPQHKINMGVTA